MKSKDASMNPKAQNSAIAAFLGCVPCSLWRPFMHDSMMKGACHHEKCYPVELPTRYTESLDAMHEAEKELTGKQATEYGNQVIAICDRDCGRDAKWAATTFFILHATAAQRAEAFLRTVGKWTDSAPVMSSPKSASDSQHSRGGDK